VARIDSNTLRLKKEKLDLIALIENVVDDVKKSLRFDSGIQINFKVGIANAYDISNSIPDKSTESDSIIVLGDSVRLSQVVSNLISNALKSIDEQGSITITVSNGTNSDRNDHAVVSVSDDGRGIAQELIPRLFLRFVSTSDKGTGLGLFISKNIVEAHGGRIWAENNTSRKGATFIFEIPLITPQSESKESQAIRRSNQIHRELDSSK
jgi:signal transduction histidine kinase